MQHKPLETLMKFEEDINISTARCFGLKYSLRRFRPLRQAYRGRLDNDQLQGIIEVDSIKATCESANRPNVDHSSIFAT